MTMNTTRHVDAADANPILLLTDVDRAWISEVLAIDIAEPRPVTAEQLAAMTDRERSWFNLARTNYLRRVPLLDTPVVTTVMEALRQHAKSSIRSDMHQQDVVILDGEPGVGKTMMLKTHAAEEMKRLAFQRSLELEHGTAEPLWTFRPVLYAHLQGPMTRNEVVRLLCDQLNWPSDTNPLPAFERAIKQCGVQLIIIDEIQHVNFGGATGRHVHNIIRWMSNAGLRVILGGTDVNTVLNSGGPAAVEVAARNSRGRWVRIDVPKLSMRNSREHEQWLDLVYAFEVRLRLVSAPTTDGWFADSFGVYAWVRTLGYLNSLILLMSRAATAAIESGTETIDRALLDSIPLQYEVERGRERRVAMFDDGTYPIMDPE
ncbi:AAA domain-containing protein [Plantibacter sp. VKM Ac-1784]|uniref:AAA domain-containing protein n=2 Tax=Plantibacter elymi (nom. nud.) TaxID=199708 RepID=A0ABY1R759_9MICO|nr:AAA domain-containing protein [Plantibacter sp. VKM Ac-1784]